jgi:GR25 family glycosyltransferase involved in LPS biosynthesis
MTLPGTFGELLEGGSYVLGLQRHESRRMAAVEKLTAAGFRRLIAAEGVDGHARPEDIDKVSAELFPGLMWAPYLTAGHRGCSLGHMRLWKYVVDAGLPYALIFEDDVLPHPLLAELGPAWWSATLDFEKRSGVALDMVLLGNQMNNAWIESLTDKVIQSPAYCLHAYIITQAGARKLLTVIEELSYARSLMPMNDILVFQMLESGRLHYCCWNRGPTERGYPVFSLDMPLAYVKTHDVAIWHRDTGLFYQNGRGGSTLHDFKPSYMFGTSDEAGDAAIKAYLKTQGEEVD